ESRRARPPAGRSYLLGNPDRGAAARLDHRRQQRIARRAARALSARGSLVGDLVLAEAVDDVLQLGVHPAQGLALAPVMLLDHAFARFGAAVRRALAHERGDRAQAEAGDAPDRRHQRRPHAPLGDEAVERLQVLLFAIFHLGDEARGVALALDTVEHGALAAIDLHRAELAGVVDADHFAEPSRTRVLAGHGRGLSHGLRSGRAATAKLASAISSEASAFQPAIEIPPSVQAISSQRGTSSGSLKSSGRMSLGSILASHCAVTQCCSTAT